ncbi:MAG: HAMP domain-containing protein [Patescibacteria group bacterium]
MQSIKSRLLWAFVSVIIMLGVASVVFFVINFLAVRQYKQINEVMIAEYRMVHDTSILIDSFNVLVQSAGTSTKESANNNINAAKADIEELIYFLDENVKDFESRSRYLGFKASVENFVSLIDDSLLRFEKGNIKDYFSDYNEANKQYEFVRENGTALLFSQLKYSSSVQDSINRTYVLSSVIGLLALTSVVFIIIVFILRFAHRLIAPLRDLTFSAQEIAKGNMNFGIDDHTLEQSSEIGTLAKSFREMTVKLKDSQEKLQIKANESAGRAEELAQKLSEIEKINNLMVDRELRMVELKEETKRLKANM